MIEAILGLGSNLGDKVKNLNNALEFLKNVPKIELRRVSNYYETAPFNVPDEQENYVNCCARIFTGLSASALLGTCLGIEAAMGRKRFFKSCSRIIDIDLLLYGDQCCTSEELTVPHPGIKHRDFVLLPLADICENYQFYNFNFYQEFSKVERQKVINLGRAQFK